MVPKKEEGIEFEDSVSDESLLVDLSEVQEQTYEAMPRGMYVCEVDQLEFTYSQTSGNPMWTWTLRVTDGEYEGRKLFFHTVFRGDGLPRTKTVIKRLAPELLEGPFDPAKVADEGTLIGKPVKARVDIRPYEGQKRNNVRDVFAVEEGEAFLG